MKEFPVATSANRTKQSLSANQCQPISKPQTQHQQTEVSGAKSLLRKISTGNTRLVHTLKKIMEEVMEAINTLNV